MQASFMIVLLICFGFMGASIAIFTQEAYTFIKSKKLYKLISSDLGVILLVSIVLSIILISISQVWINHVIITTVPDALQGIVTDTLGDPNQSILDPSAGARGDTFGGTFGPLIGWFAALATFAAFWVQYKANKNQRDDLKIERFENRFFIFINYSRDNVEQMSYPDPNRSGDGQDPII